MKIRFYLDSGANIDSKNLSDILDVEEDLGLTDKEFENMVRSTNPEDHQKLFQLCLDYMYGFDWGYKKIIDENND